MNDNKGVHQESPKEEPVKERQERPAEWIQPEPNPERPEVGFWKVDA